MLVEDDFAVLQTEYVHATMALFPAFRPDGQSPEEVASLLAGAGHDAARDVFANLRGRYRMDPVTMASVDRLPVEDKTVAQTLKRLESIAPLWAKPPVPPGTAPANLPPPPPAPRYAPWPGMDLPAFRRLHQRLDDADDADDAIPALAQAAQKAEGQIHVRGAELSDFAVAAAQGRAQFTAGTAAREVVDALPAAPATSPAHGEALLVYDAPHGTRFDIPHQAPGAADYETLAEGVLLKRFTARGLAAGSHGFKVAAGNSVGTGAESAVGTVVVG